MEFKEFKYFVQHYHITKCQNQNLNLIICDLKPFRGKKKKKPALKLTHIEEVLAIWQSKKHQEPVSSWRQ